MPYNKRKQKCKQSDGNPGSYVLSYADKKGKKHSACHTSKKNMQGQIAAIEAEADETDMPLVEEALLRKYISTLLKEDAMGFVHALAASDKFGDDFFGGDIGKETGRDIKRSFAKHADHQWLSTIDTVHWGSSPYGLKDLAGKGKDELSTTMALPGDPLRAISFLPFGLWIKGRITLATDTQDTLYSGKKGDYDAPHEGSEDEVTHRDKSSGRNKRPTISKNYKNYGKLERGNEYMEKMARNIPYVLDQSTWSPTSPDATNEALVDNWKPVGIVIAKSDVEEAIIAAAKKLVSGGQSPPSGNTVKDIQYFAAGAVKEAMLVALELGIPIYNTSRTELWSPSDV
tara:strand:- start:890 stop:1918 length:1029 start_codon:yes stop_codon:yes gene_type:complete